MTFYAGLIAIAALTVVVLYAATAYLIARRFSRLLENALMNSNEAAVRDLHAYFHKDWFGRLTLKMVSKSLRIEMEERVQRMSTYDRLS